MTDRGDNWFARSVRLSLLVLPVLAAIVIGSTFRHQSAIGGDRGRAGATTELVSDSAIAMGAAAAMHGMDIEKEGTLPDFPLQQAESDLAVRQVRNTQNVSDITRASLAAPFANFASRGRVGRFAYCPSFSTDVEFQVSDVIARLQKWQRAVAGTDYAPALIHCSFYEGQNEYDDNITYRPEGIGQPGPGLICDPARNDCTWPSGPLAKAITATPLSPNCISVADGLRCAENSPGGDSACNAYAGSRGAGYYNCAPPFAYGSWLYISDGSKSEHVQVTNFSAKDGGTITAIYRYPHTTKAVMTVDIYWVMAEWQLQMYLILRHQYPQYSDFELTTVALDSIYNDLAGYDAAFVQVTAAHYPGSHGYHLWQTPPGAARPFSDALNYHMGSCNYYPFQADWVNDWRHEFDVAIRSVPGSDARYRWQKPPILGEANVAFADGFGNGSPHVPYIPAGAGDCDVPQMVSATYAAAIPFLLFAKALPVRLQFELSPILYDNSAGTLLNSYMDLAYNPKPIYYALANSMAFVQDPAFDAATFVPDTLVYPNPARLDWCVSHDGRSAPYNVPAGCTIFHATFENQHRDEFRMIVQRIPVEGIFPNNGMTPACTPLGSHLPEANFGACPGISPPSPYPTEAPPATPYYLLFPSSRIKQAVVYHDSGKCDIPTNVEWTPSPQGDATPDPTPTPIFTTAPNSQCFRFMPSAVVTPQPGGTLRIRLPSDTNAIWIDMATGNSTPLPVVTPIPMRDPLPTPSPNPSGWSFPWNQYRTGVYNPVVALPRSDHGRR